MSYNATVLRVLIASPSDLPSAREAAEGAIHSWNAAHSRTKAIVLQPWCWEESAVPILGDHPQAIINAQGVDDSDIVFALFGGRLGSPTPDAVSGTAEEIDRAVAKKIPVHVFFSTAPLPNDVDTPQLEALREFKRIMQTRGLLGEFNTTDELRYEIWKAIEHDLTQLDVSAGGQPAVKETRVDFLAQPGRDREQTGIDAKGRVKYQTHHWVDITNRGSRDAQDVTMEPADDTGGLFLIGSNQPTTIHAGQTRRFPFSLAMAAGDPVVAIRWREDDEAHEQTFHIG